MGLISFLKDAGEKLFHAPATSAASSAAAPAGSPAPDVAALNATASQAIASYVAAQHLTADGLAIQYDGATQAVTVSGTAPDQATREKIVLCCGNVASVASVNDQLTVAAAAEPPSTYRTVQSGDTLSKIAQDAYGHANDYMKIFEANKPMLSDPNNIYPGQVLRLPPRLNGNHQEQSMGLMDILQQYVGGAVAPGNQTEEHFNQVAQQTPPAQLGQGVAAAFRSDATPPFSQMVGELFGKSNPQQQAGLLGQLAQTLGPSALSGLGGGALGSALGGLLGGGGQQAGASAAVPPAAAAQVSPSDVAALAARAEQQDPSVVDKVGAFYAAHPTLVQSLGAVALSAVMGHLSSAHRS